MNLSDPILALGAGESGVGSALLAKSLGARAFVSDAGEGKGPGVAELLAEGIEYEVGGHRFNEWPEVGTVVKSPGIPEHAAVVQECRERGWEVISEIEYAARAHRALRHATPVVAVTGANGKTTTTSMIDHMLRHEGWDVDCVGNIDELGQTLGRARVPRRRRSASHGDRSEQLPARRDEHLPPGRGCAAQHHARPSGPLRVRDGELRRVQMAYYRFPDPSGPPDLQRGLRMDPAHAEPTRNVRPTCPSAPNATSTR